MEPAVDKLPDDVESFKALLRAERNTTGRLQKKIQTLFEAIRLARHQRFCASSKKAPGQGELFDEAEASLNTSEDAS